MNQQYLILNGQPMKRKMSKLIEALRTIRDRRDNRGKQHKLPFVLSAVVLAILSGRAAVSSIQRYRENRIDWLREVTGEKDANFVSPAQLPRILSTVDRAAVDRITLKHFGMRLVQGSDGEWNAVDGKTLRGTTDEQGHQRTRILTAVNHASRETVAQSEMSGCKNSEITAVRTFLHETGLEKEKVTLDALPMNPTTTAQIEQAEGDYLIQTKRNQPTLYDTLTTVASSQPPFAIFNTSEQGHGRQEERWAWFFPLDKVSFDDRWNESGLRTLVVVLR